MNYIFCIFGIKSLLLDPLYAHWPIASLSWYALRNNIVQASVHSWYRYASILGIKRPKPASRRKKNKIGIRAQKVGEMIHADVTKFKLPNNVIAFIYIVIDNFSKYILSCKVETFLSAKTMKEALTEARNKLPKNIDPILITDNGSENVLANTVEPKFLSHLHAQTDIDFSNSMVEAVNKIVKYYYLYNKEISDIISLRKALTECEKDYNEIRPHYSLKGLTPLECFEGKESQMINANQKLITARNERLMNNKNTKCKGC